MYTRILIRPTTHTHSISHKKEKMLKRYNSKVDEGMEEVTYKQ